MCWFLLVPGLLACIAFDPNFREKVVEMERAHPTENFHLGFDAYHSLQLSTDRFFRVNGKQRTFPVVPVPGMTRQMYLT